MSDIKRTALIVFILTLLSSNFTSFAYAANDVDHDELMQYEGYAEAMYESIVEQTTFITGQYTENKDYVNQSIDEIKDYANFWANERQGLENACGGLDLFSTNCLGTITEKAGGYALTVGDIIKNLFSDYKTEEEVTSNFDYAFYNQVFGQKQPGQIFVNPGWSVSVYNGQASGGWVHENRILQAYYSGSYYILNIGGFTGYHRSENLGIQLETMEQIINFYLSIGYKMIFTKDNQTYEPSSPTSLPHRAEIRDYVNNNPITLPVPQLSPSLVCPDGTRIKMGINGSAFISVNGETMLVNKDGTAEVNGSICNLNWQKPTVEYTPDGQVKITQPDGTESESTPGFTDLEGCNGAIMCGIAKLLDGLGSLVKAITGLVAKILDGILALFVPEDLDFMTQEFNKITKKLNDKIAITETLKQAITGVFDGGGSNPLANISINLPITNEPLTFGNVSFIEEGVPILRRVISAIVVLYTIAYVYRKITGRGGVMER